MNLQKAAKEYAENKIEDAEPNSQFLTPDGVETLREDCRVIFEAGGNYVLGELNAQLIAKEQRIAELEKKLLELHEKIGEALNSGAIKVEVPFKGGCLQNLRDAAHIDVDTLTKELKSPEAKHE